MSYRFLRICDYYPGMINSFFEFQHSGKFRTAGELKTAISRFSCDNVHAYTRELIKLKVEADDLVSNIPLWYKLIRDEHPEFRNLPDKMILIRMIEKQKPDVIWVDDLSLADTGWIGELKKRVSSLRLLITHICAPFRNETTIRRLRNFNMVVTCVPCFMSELSELGFNVRLVYHAFDQDILNLLPEAEKKKYGLVFSGSLYTGPMYHQDRIRYVEALLQSGIPVDLFCNLESASTTLKKKAAYLTHKLAGPGMLKYLSSLHPAFSRLHGYDQPVKGYSSELKKRNHNPVFGIKMYETLHQSEACFNLQAGGDCCGSMRMFEATGAGTCLLTDRKKNLRELFEPDSEVVAFDSLNECIEKAKWLMENPVKRKAIADAGRARVLRDHTIASRADQLHHMILEELKTG